MCKIWDADYPWDVRVEKVVTTLAAEGWDIDLVCRNERRLPRLERRGRLHIHRLPCASSALGPVNRVLNFPYFFNPVWMRQIAGVCRRRRPDLILVRDLPLAISGLVIGRALGTPVVVDLAENYPAMLRDIRRFEPFRPANVLVRNPRMAAWIERYVVRRADHVIVVVEEAASRLVRLGVDPSKITIVSNTPWRRQTDDLAGTPRPADMRWGDPILMYLGNMDPGRGLDTAVRAMPIVLEAAPEAHLVIIGSGTQAGALRAMTARLEVQQAVTFLGRMAHHAALSYLPHADICLVPHDRTESNNTTISNKLFDYMAAGRPVLVSDCPPTARIVRSTGCGVVFAAGDPQAFAAEARKLLDPGSRRLMGQRGFHAFRSVLHWERDAERLVGALAAVARPKTGAVR
ncbi:MAG: glycosyltransferase family 4 protein, partial [Candidatus Rokuibacteriota bacterium]